MALTSSSLGDTHGCDGFWRGFRHLQNFESDWQLCETERIAVIAHLLVPRSALLSGSPIYGFRGHS